jgi:O-antigen/teichoic acid export membrane protein
LKFLSQITNKSEFNRNVFTLFTGQVIVQVISFAVGFIITRLYAPEQIGIYSLFIGVVTILTVVATGRYDAAIVVEEKDEKVKSLWLLSLIVSFIFNLLLFIFLFFLSEPLLNYLNVDGLGKWVLLIPFTVFIATIVKTTQFYFNKYAQYKKMKNSDIIKSSSNSGFSVGFGLIKFLNGGLILANVIGNIFSAVYLLLKLPSQFWKEIAGHFSINKLKFVAIKYKNYLGSYSLSGLLNALVSNGTPLFIIYFFSEKIAGYYFMAEKVISIPLGLIVASISKVFYQKASELYREDKVQFLGLINSIQKKMVLFLLPFLILVTIGAPYFFKLFGEGWEYAGEMVKYFAILVFCNNIVSPVGSISNILNRLDILLYFNISIAIFRVVTFYLGSLYLNFEYSLLFSSVVISMCYLTLDFVLKRIIKKEISQ